MRTLSHLRVEASPRAPGLGMLDPIEAYMLDHRPGAGSLTLTCYGLAWTCYWGAMGEDSTVAQFLGTVGAGYVANCLVRGKGQFPVLQRKQRLELDYLEEIVRAVQGELKRRAMLAQLAAADSPWPLLDSIAGQWVTATKTSAHARACDVENQTGA